LTQMYLEMTLKMVSVYLTSTKVEPLVTAGLTLFCPSCHPTNNNVKAKYED